MIFFRPTTCFETFPFPEPTDEQRDTIAAAAKELDALRNNWLNPPEWTRTEVLEFPGTADGPWRRYVSLECGGSTPLSLDTQNAGEQAASKPDGDRPSQSGVKPPHSKVA